VTVKAADGNDVTIAFDDSTAKVRGTALHWPLQIG
jgi:hypothetical protein